MKIAVSGANGWLGRSSLWNLSKEEKIEKIVPITRISTKINLQEFKFNSINFDNAFDIKEDIDGLIHLPFVTRDKVSKMTLARYIEQNLILISWATKFIELKKPKWVISISSGAVYKNGNNLSQELENNIENNPYGFLKRIEEITLADTCKKINSNFVSGRLWGATGYDMQNYEPYAIGQFIFQALQNKTISVTSTINVIRNYIDSRQFMSILIKEALIGSNLIIDSFGQETSIRDLAKKVSDQFPNSKLEYPEKLDMSKSDNYYPKNDDFLRLFSKWDVKLMAIEDQIMATIKGIRFNLGMESNE